MDRLRDAVCFAAFTALTSGGCKAKETVNADATPSASVEQVSVTQPEAAERKQPTPADIRVLLAEYKDNEVRADEKYKGMTIATAGKVGAIKKDSLGHSYVMIGSGHPDLDALLIQCFPKDDQLKSVEALSRDSLLAVSGKVAGLVLSSIVLSDCEILLSTPPQHG